MIDKRRPCFDGGKFNFGRHHVEALYASRHATPPALNSHTVENHSERPRNMLLYFLVLFDAVP